MEIFRTQLVFKGKQFICIAPAGSPVKVGYNAIEVIDFPSYERLNTGYKNTLIRCDYLNNEIDELKNKLRSHDEETEYGQSMG
jgi:hypothetical protein